MFNLHNFQSKNLSTKREYLKNMTTEKFTVKFDNSYA